MSGQPERVFEVTVTEEERPNSTLIGINAGGIATEEVVGIHSIAEKDKNPLAELTSLEKKMLLLAAQGATNEEIGEKVFLSPVTIRSYFPPVYKKIDVKNRNEAVIWARRTLLNEGLEEDPLYQFTPREKSVLSYLAKGLSSAQISELLGVRPRTVREYTVRLQEKLAVSDRRELVKAAGELILKKEKYTNDQEPLVIEVGEIGNASMDEKEMGPERFLGFNKDNKNIVEQLSSRELEVLVLGACGLSNPEIAQQLFVTERTIKFHLGNIYGKLGIHPGARNRIKAGAIAVELGLIKSVITQSENSGLSHEALKAIDSITTKIKAKAISDHALLEKITPREHSVLEALETGLENKQIAEALGIAEQTIKFHLGNIYRKLGVKNRTETIIFIAWTKESKDFLKDGKIVTEEWPVGDGLNIPNMKEYRRFDSDLELADREHKAAIVSNQARGALEHLWKRGILDRFYYSQTGTISARNQELLKGLADAGYISEDMAGSGQIDLTGILALEMSKDPNARAVLWGTEKSRGIAKTVLVEEIDLYHREVLAA